MKLFYLNFLTEHLALAVLWSAMGLWLLWEVLQPYFHQINAVETDTCVTLMNCHQALIVDARDTLAYKRAHITAAISLPSKQFDQASKWSYPKDRPLVVYADSDRCALQLAVQLKKHYHLTRVSYLKGGVASWQMANLPLVQPKQDSSQIEGKTEKG